MAAENARSTKDPVRTVPEYPTISIFDYLGILWRRRRLFLTLVVVLTAIMIVVLLVMPQTFVAGAVLLPPDRAEGVSLTSLVQSSKSLDFASLTENSSAEVLVKMIASRTVADSLIGRYDLLGFYHIDKELRPLAIDATLGNLDVSADRQGFISVQFTVTTPWFATDADRTQARRLSAKVVNGAIDLLDHMNREKNVSRARRSREFLDRMRRRKRAELDSIQLRMQEFQKVNKAFSINEQAQVSLDALISIQTEISKMEIQLAAAETSYQGGPVLDALRSQLAKLKQQKASLEQGNIGSSRMGFPLSGVPELMRQFLGLKLDLEVATEIWTYLEAQYHQQAVQEARDLPTVSVLDPARPPLFRSRPRRTFLLIVSFVAIVMLSVITAFATERLALQLQARRRASNSADSTPLQSTSE